MPIEFFFLDEPLPVTKYPKQPHLVIVPDFPTVCEEGEPILRDMFAFSLSFRK